MKPIILFGIDYTLINTSRLRELVESANCLHLRIDQNIYRELIGEYVAGLASNIEFSPRNYVRFLENKLHKQIPVNDLLANYFSNPDLYRNSLYLETLSVLNVLSEHYSLGIFSEGVKEFQIAKIELSGIVQYLNLDLVFIYPDKTGKALDILRQHRHFCLVDDNLRHLFLYRNQVNIKKILVRREDKHLSQSEPLPSDILMISSLTELPALVDKTLPVSLSSDV